MSTGAREVWAQAPTLGMAVRAEGAILATKSHWPLWEGSSYILLLLWSGRHQFFIYVLYCNFDTKLRYVTQKCSCTERNLDVTFAQDDKETTQLSAWESSHSLELISHAKEWYFATLTKLVLYFVRCETTICVQTMQLWTRMLQCSCAVLKFDISSRTCHR
jgi:hypothetical protein